MRLTIKARGIELTEELQTFITRRVHFAMSRMVDVVRRVDVNVIDVNGPRGGVDKLCRVRVHGLGLPEIIIEERDAQTESAVATATARASRAVLRAIARRRPIFLRSC